MRVFEAATRSPLHTLTLSSVCIAHRPFDLALPDTNPAVVERTFHDIAAAAKGTPYETKLRRWREMSESSTNADTESGSYAEAALLMHSLGAPGRAGAGADRKREQRARDTASTTTPAAPGQEMTLVDELQQQLLVLHAECFLLRQAMVSGREGARPPPLHVGGIDEGESRDAVNVDADARTPEASGGSPAGGAQQVGHAYGSLEDETQSERSVLKAQIERLTQALRERETECENLELELAGQRQTPATLAASILQSTTAGGAQTTPASTGETRLPAGSAILDESASAANTAPSDSVRVTVSDFKVRAGNLHMVHWVFERWGGVEKAEERKSDGKMDNLACGNMWRDLSKKTL